MHSISSSMQYGQQKPAPQDWSLSILLSIPKKGDRTVCRNYRGISLIDVAAKIFAMLLLERFASERNQRMRPNQGGFRPGRGCIDQIFTLRRLLEHRYKNQQPTTALFIDFKTAFDSIDRDALWNIMIADGIPPKLVRLIKAYYTATTARVRVLGADSPTFSLTAGVRQICPMSPVLFNFAIDWIMNQATEVSDGCWLSPECKMTDLDYADDIVILGDTPSNLQPMLDKISLFSMKVNLKINVSKTKLFTTHPDPNQLLALNGERIEQVSEFRYLGSTILPNGQAKNEIPQRISNARLAFTQLSKALWSRSDISLHTKLHVYRVSIRPVLLYGCETWPLRATDNQALKVFDRWCLRRIANIRWPDRVSNEELYRRCDDIPCLSNLMQQRRLQWFGHVLRKPNTEPCRAALAPGRFPNWRFRHGGQLKTWLNTIKSDIDATGIGAAYSIRRWNRDWVHLCADLAADRRQWHAITRDIHEAGSSRRR